MGRDIEDSRLVYIVTQAEASSSCARCVTCCVLLNNFVFNMCSYVLAPGTNWAATPSPTPAPGYCRCIFGFGAAATVDDAQASSASPSPACLVFISFIPSTKASRKASLPRTNISQSSHHFSLTRQNVANTGQKNDYRCQCSVDHGVAITISITNDRTPANCGGLES